MPRRVFLRELRTKIAGSSQFTNPLAADAFFFNFLNPTTTYTKAQLALRNGQDRDEIWVAYRGTIYDVTKSRLWRNGQHYEHWAGQDLTDELPDAPTARAYSGGFRWWES